MKFLKNFSNFGVMNESYKEIEHTYVQLLADLEAGKVSVDLKLPDSYKHKQSRTEQVLKDVTRIAKRRVERYNQLLASGDTRRAEYTNELLLPFPLSDSSYIDPISGETFGVVLFEPHRISVGRATDDIHNYANFWQEIEQRGDDSFSEDFEIEIDVPSGILCIGGDWLYQAVVKTIDGWDDFNMTNEYYHAYGAAKEHFDFVQKHNIFYVPESAYPSYYRNENGVTIASQTLELHILDEEDGDLSKLDYLGKKIGEAGSDTDMDHALVICDKSVIQKSLEQHADEHGNLIDVNGRPYKIGDKVDQIKVETGRYVVKYKYDRSDESKIYCVIEKR
jgi:hypothetical protein